MFGAGFGAAQNLTLLSAFARAGEGGATAASAMWNASFDAGTATGALVLGLVAAGIGLPVDLRARGRAAGRVRARGLRSGPEHGPLLIGGVHAVGGDLLRPDEQDLLTGPAQPRPQAVGVVAVGVAQLAQSHLSGARLGPLGRGRVRDSARATAVSPAPKKTRSRRSVRSARKASAPSASPSSRAMNASARRGPFGLRIGGTHPTTVPGPPAGVRSGRARREAGRQAGEVPQASRRRKVSQATSSTAATSAVNTAKPVHGASTFGLNDTGAVMGVPRCPA